MTANARPRSAGQLSLWTAPAAAVRPDPHASGDRRRQAAPRPSSAVVARPVGQVGVPRPTARQLAAGQKVKGPARERHEADPWLIIATIALSAVGMLMIYSTGAATLSAKTSDITGAMGQELMWVVLGVTAMLLLSRMDYRWLRLVSVPLFLGALGLLVIVLGSAIGPIAPKVVNGSARWLTIAGGLSFHPAEIA